MLLSHECPLFLLDKSRQFNDYNYYLDVFMLNKKYNNFFRSDNRITYLDCSLYERTLYKNIEDLDISIYKSLYKKLSREINSVYCIVPDYKDSSEKCINELNNFTDIERKIVTVHGKTYSEFKDCFYYYRENLKGEFIVALSAIDSFSNVESRTRFLDDISKDDLKGIKIHVFGLYHPEEMRLLSTVKDKVYSLDTSLPIISTLVNAKIDELREKPRCTIFSMLNDETDIDYGLLEHNLNYIRSVLN